MTCDNGCDDEWLSMECKHCCTREYNGAAVDALNRVRDKCLSSNYAYSPDMWLEELENEITRLGGGVNP